MIKAILFDYDGTLSDRRLAAYNMYRHCLGKMRPDLDPAGVEFEGIVQHLMVADQNGMVPKSYVWRQLKENYIPDLDVERWADYWFSNFNNFQCASPGAAEILPQLRKHFKTGILSNGAYESQLAKIKSLKMDELVDEVVISGQYGIAKPDPRIFEIAAEKLGVSCEETVFCGDMFFTDVTGAYAAGMKPVWFDPQETVSRTNIPRVKNFRELYDFLMTGGGSQ